MISFTDALKTIKETASLLPCESIPLLDSLLRISAESVNANEQMPPFDNSAMDGYAVMRKDTLNPPTKLPVIGTIIAGDLPIFKPTIMPAAYEIMTGAPLPSGYDCVIKMEDVEPEEGFVKIFKPGDLLENVRRKGEDFQTEDIIIANGTRIMPKHIMALASFGVTHIKVRKRPTISILTTGNELISYNEQTRGPLPAGKIRDNNGPYLLTALKLLGAEPRIHKTIPDDSQAFIHQLEEILQNSPDIIITTGAVSKGKFDFIYESLHKINAKILFHGVAIRPGKPILFAKLNSTAFFGLPGNPISAAVGLRFFVEPYLSQLLGTPIEKTIKATLQNETNKSKDLLCFYKARLNIQGEKPLVSILEGQSSHMINSLLKSNAWAILAPGREKFGMDEAIDVLPLHREMELS